MKKNICLILTIMSCLIVLSCTKTDDYKALMKDIKYPGKVDSALVLTGKNRAFLKMKLSSDPSIEKVMVFWNNRTDSVEMNVINRDSLEATLMIEPLAEGSYLFELFTEDTHGSRSIPIEVQGTVLRNSYLATLYNRPLNELGLSDNGREVVLEWGSRSENEIASEIL